MVAPNVYVLGGKPEIVIETYDIAGALFIPSLVRLSIKQPDGVIVTLSGAELSTGSGYLFYDYRPPTIGWYEYETWVRDPADREDTATNGFEVIDRVY